MLYLLIIVLVLLIIVQITARIICIKSNISLIAFEFISMACQIFICKKQKIAPDPPYIQDSCKFKTT